MCAIFGLGFMKGHTVEDSEMVRKIIRNMFVEAQASGRTASGLAMVTDREFNVIKKNVPGEELIRLPEYEVAESKYMSFSTASQKDAKRGISKSPPLSFIGHCRLKTKGSELDNHNNHPIVRKDVVGVHNGMISNDDAIFRIYEKTFPRNGYVDSEAIFALVEHFSKGAKPIHKAIQKMSRALTGGMACAMAHRFQPYIVWLFRRGNPCDVVIYRKVGLVMWATWNRYIETAVRDYREYLGAGEPVVLNQDSGVGIDLYRNIVHRFDMERYRYQDSVASA